jgi:hypothetical protein
MAGAVVITEVTHTIPKKVTFAWDGTTVDGTTTAYFNGVLLLVATVPGLSGAQPDDNYDLELNNADGVDMLAAQGINRDETNTEFIASGMGAFTEEKIVLSITNAGAAAEGVVYVWLR